MQTLQKNFYLFFFPNFHDSNAFQQCERGNEEDNGGPKVYPFQVPELFWSTEKVVRQVYCTLGIILQGWQNLQTIWEMHKKKKTLSLLLDPLKTKSTFIFLLFFFQRGTTTSENQINHLAQIQFTEHDAEVKNKDAAVSE